MDGYEGLDRVTVAEAAHRLGVKEQAIRKRIQRGTLHHDKEEDGRVYVYIDAKAEDEVQGMGARGNTYLVALVESLQDQTRFLREELARKDAILMNMTQTMRQLTAPAEEAPPEEPPESPTEATEQPGRVEPRSGTGAPQTSSERPRDTAEFPVGGSLTRPWWRRVFGG